MQSDKGREFVNVIVLKMLDEFNIKMVNGAPRHSQSPGSVERGNKDIEDLLYTWISTNKTRPSKQCGFCKDTINCPEKLMKISHFN